MQNNLVVGLLAHVDAGKTTLSEGLLFRGGCLRRLGRVDHKDSFLDTDLMERKRGITIFSKQAVLPLDGVSLTLLDTPGHIDFSAEMERTLQVLDYAVLIINGSDGIQAHTITLWRLLARYKIPAFIFINKMDLPETNALALLSDLKSRLDKNCCTFSNRQNAHDLYEDIAMCDDEALSLFFEQDYISDGVITDLVNRRRLFPCFFGSALKLDGVDDLLCGLQRYARPPVYSGEFGAKVFKITRDKQNNRLTYLKITGGSLRVKTALSDGNKVNQIRVYSGEKYSAVEEAFAGMVCAVTGLNRTYPGQGFGAEAHSPPPALEPVLSFRLLLPDGCDALGALSQLRQLEEEDPQLAISWTEQTQEIHFHLMGEVQLEILHNIILERFGLETAFAAGKILYRETIAEPVIGVGHFEPLRHYAEVHLLLEPALRGSGLQFDTNCSEDILSRNWQRLILAHLQEREHPGVLTGSPVTDMKITLLTGKAHNKHTEGGDFRQATYRAVRQGLMQAKSILLEPWYEFRLEAPNQAVGRAMTDLRRVSNDLSLPETNGENTFLTGSAPVAAIRDYAAEVTAYTRGLGRLSCSFTGFAPCHNQDEAVAEIGYNAERDTENPADSVFCSHGTGFIVKWDQVKNHAHISSSFSLTADEQAPQVKSYMNTADSKQENSPTLEKELQSIYEQTYGPVKRRDAPPRFAHTEKKIETVPTVSQSKPLYDGPDYLLVDGYNIIYAWQDLCDIAQQNMDAARQSLMDILSNYRGFRDREIILVFDAYKVSGGAGNVSRYQNISVVYTKEAETADSYIEKVTYRIGKNHRVSVATSDGAVQMIILGHGALRLSPHALRAEIETANTDISAIIQVNNSRGHAPTIILPE